MEKFKAVPVAEQIKALLDIADELDAWSAKFVTSLSEWIGGGKRLTYRQQEALLEAFERYDPLFLKSRRRRNVYSEQHGRTLTVHEAIAILKDRSATFDVSDARFVQKVIAMTADGGAVTDRAGNRIKDMFDRLGLWQLVRRTGFPRPTPAWPATRGGPDPRALAAEIAKAAAERAAIKGPLH